MHISGLINSIYEYCDWDSTSNSPGRPILLEDVVDAVIAFRSRYGKEVRQNIFGALVSRIKNLLQKPSLVALLNTSSGITIKELLEHPTIIEMDELSENNKILLMGILTSAVSEYKLANPTKDLTNLLVLEEAHYLLGRTDLSGEANSGIRLQAVHAFTKMLRVLGGAGVGVVLIDQSPSELASQAVKIPVNMVLFALGHQADRDIAAAHTRCTDAQKEHIAGMQVGEAVVYLQHEGTPKNVKVIPLQELLVQKLPDEILGVDAVKEHMASIFAKYPHLREYHPLSAGLIERLDGETAPTSDMESSTVIPTHRITRDRLERTVTSEKFVWYVNFALDNRFSRHLAEFIQQTAASLGDGGIDRAFEILDILREKWSTSRHETVLREVEAYLRKGHV